MLVLKDIFGGSFKTTSEKRFEAKNSLKRFLGFSNFSTEARTPKRFFGTFLGTPFGAGTFRSTLFGSLFWSGRRHFFIRRTVLESSCEPCYQRDARNFLLNVCQFLLIVC